MHLEKKRVNKKLYITFFESQIIRSFLNAENSDFTFILAQEFDIKIITSSELDSIVQTSIDNLNLRKQVEIFTFNSYRDSFISRATSFLLYWLNESPTIELKVNRFKPGIKRSTISVLRFLINGSAAIRRFLVGVLRSIFWKSISESKLRQGFESNLKITSEDLLFVTSLTNFWQDVPVAVFFKKHKAKIVGTVRSWDNLTSHGYLRIIPNKFISHSEIMSTYASYYQHISPGNNVLGVTPVYQDFIRKKWGKNPLKRRNISYMCMGLHINPDERDFIHWLIQEMKVLNRSVNFTIVQHPKFRVDFNSKILDFDVDSIVFEYTNSNLLDYYEFLASQDLILCGGTTAALDGVFVGVTVLGINFEIKERNKFVSALRYFDTLIHTKNFFKVCKVPTVRSKEELLSALSDFNQIPKFDDSMIIKFTGDSKINFSKLLSGVLKTLID